MVRQSVPWSVTAQPDAPAKSTATKAPSEPGTPVQLAPPSVVRKSAASLNPQPTTHPSSGLEKWRSVAVSAGGAEGNAVQEAPPSMLRWTSPFASTASASWAPITWTAPRSTVPTVARIRQSGVPEIRVRT